MMKLKCGYCGSEYDLESMIVWANRGGDAFKTIKIYSDYGREPDPLCQYGFTGFPTQIQVSSCLRCDQKEVDA